MKTKKDNKNKIILIFMLLLLFTFLFFILLNKMGMPIIMNYANVQTKKMGIEVLKSTGLNEVNRKIKEDNFYKIEKNNNGEIESIDFNTALFNETLTIISKNVRKRLSEIEKGKNLPSEMYNNVRSKKIKKGIVYEIPIGVVFKNSFLSNLGPKVPVKVEYSGNVSLDVKSKVKSYGVNSALIEVYIYVETTQRTILPFRSKDVKITSEIPIIMKVVKGTTPNYLSGIKDSLSLPSK